MNPIKHIDIFGTIIIPLVLVLTAGLAFGYAKPVPVNTWRMNRNQAMLTGLCGPFTNIVLAVLAAGAIHLVFQPGQVVNSTTDLILTVIYYFGIVNVVLAVFNMIPIPPLDGSAVVERFLPQQYMAGYLKFRQYAMLLLIVIVLLGQSVLGRIFSPFIELWQGLLP